MSHEPQVAVLKAYTARALPPGVCAFLVQHENAETEMITVLSCDDALAASLCGGNQGQYTYRSAADSMPSVRAACTGGQTLLAVPYPSATCSAFSDLDGWRSAHGMRAFVVLPVALAGRDLGALLLMTAEPKALDPYALRLAHELAGALGQTLYTRLCLDEVAADQEIMARAASAARGHTLTASIELADRPALP